MIAKYSAASSSFLITRWRRLVPIGGWFSRCFLCSAALLFRVTHGPYGYTHKNIIIHFSLDSGPAGVRLEIKSSQRMMAEKKLNYLPVSEG